MDFFSRQDRARRHTQWLVLYFALAVLLTVAAVYLAVAVVFHWQSSERVPAPSLWNPDLFLVVAGVTLGVILIGSLVKILELSKGGSAVATLLGGRPLNPESTDPDERRLLNVVEEMAIASGVPVPEVYVLPQEEGINAFAAGHATSDAVIGVTKGCLRLLSRDELQGVIAHEFSHILNGDMRLNLRLIGIVSGILGLAILGRILLYTRGRRNPLPLLGLLLILIGAIGVFFGRLIKSAISRQREFLADAAAVQFTRNPDGLAGALKKIGGLSQGSRLQTAHAEEASHLFFSNGLASSFSRLMSTHPPLEERIRALDPAFDGRFPRVELPARQPSAGRAPVERGRPPRPPIIPAPQVTDLVGAQAAPLMGAARVSARQVSPQAGTVTPRHLAYAATLRHSLPEPLARAAHEPMSANALLYGMVLSPDAVLRSRQLQHLRSQIAPAVFGELQKLLQPLRSLAASARLPLVMLSLPALRRLSPGQFAAFKQNLQVLVESDREIDLFEYTLQKVVLHHLEPHYGRARKPAAQFYALPPLAKECAVLLSALARLGHTQEADIERAFRAGATPLEQDGMRLTLLPFSACGLAQVDQTLNRLALAAPAIKKRLLSACADAAAADGIIRGEEAELLRAIADTLDVPLPPFVEEG